MMQGNASGVEPGGLEESGRELRAPAPVTGGERLASVDVLRGVAVLGILAMNIYAYALPSSAYQNPTSAGGFLGLDRIVWWICFLFFSFKMMPIFSMLFGAGLALMYGRYSPKGISFKRFWYRRILLLMLIGAVHGYLLWAGDVLFLYSVCGLFIFLFRKMHARRLLAAAVVFFAIGFLPVFGAGYYFGMVRDRMMPVIDWKLESGDDLSRAEQATKERWEEMQKYFHPTEDQLEENIAVYRDGYAGMLADRAPVYLMGTTIMLVFGAFWPTTGLMLAGMALMKSGVFSAARSNRTYVLMALGGYGAGLPLAWWSAHGMIASGFSMVEMFRYYSPLNQLGGPLVSIGHIGVVMLAFRMGLLPGLAKSLAAAGRMALSNYLAQTLICTTIFYGYGFGLYASFGRAVLMLFVAGIWVLELMVSRAWIARFNFGPLEWLWRSLTYGRIQPMRRAWRI